MAVVYVLWIYPSIPELSADDSQVPNRTQFKHVIFAPQAWSGYDEAYFPAIRDAIDSGNWTDTQFWIDKAASVLKQASLNLLRR